MWEIFEFTATDEPDPESHLEEFYHPDDRETVREAIRRAIVDGEPFELEVRILPESGTERWVQLYGTPREDDDGYVTHVRGALHDITDQKRSEQQLDLLRQVLSRVFRHNIRTT